MKAKNLENDICGDRQITLVTAVHPRRDTQPLKRRRDNAAQTHKRRRVALVEVQEPAAEKPAVIEPTSAKETAAVDKPVTVAESDEAVPVKEIAAVEKLAVCETSHKENGDGTITIVLHPFRHHLVTNIGEDDPGSYLVWDDDKLEAARIEINATNPAPIFPDWCTGPPIHDIRSFKRDIMHHLALAGGQQRVGSLIAPNTASEYARITRQMLCLKWISPFSVISDVNLPIATHYVLKDRAYKTRAEREAIDAPPGIVGIIR